MFYGEPNPDKIPTGTMTTFEPIAKIVAGGKSLAKNASCKVDGRRTWKREFDQMRGIRYAVTVRVPVAQSRSHYRELTRAGPGPTSLGTVLR